MTGLEDNVLNALESICNIFDNVYFFKSIGVLSEKNILYRTLNKGDFGSKLWFLTLLLSSKKLITRLTKSLKIRAKIKKEIDESPKENDEDKSLVNSLLREKLELSLAKCMDIIRNNVLELLQTMMYLSIAFINVFKVKVPQKWKHLLEQLSNIITIIRVFISGYSSL